MQDDVRMSLVKESIANGKLICFADDILIIAKITMKLHP